MRLLFEMNKNDYKQCDHIFIRNSARAVIFKENRIAMIRSLKYDYYKFPGGGIETREEPIDALIRETREEAGLLIIPSSIKEYGYVHRIQKSDKDETECFIQDNFYYLCETEDVKVSQQLDPYEAQEAFQLEYVCPEIAIERNRCVRESPYNPWMFEREARVLECLLMDGYMK